MVILLILTSLTVNSIVALKTCQHGNTFRQVQITQNEHLNENLRKNLSKPVKNLFLKFFLFLGGGNWLKLKILSRMGGTVSAFR